LRPLRDATKTFRAAPETFDTLTFEGLRMRYFAADWNLFRPLDLRISEAKPDSTPLACVAGPSRLGISRASVGKSSQSP